VPRPKGSKKTVGSGRKKGTPNRAIKALRATVAETLKARGFDPIEELVKIVKHRYTTVEMRAKCSLALAEYLYPKLVRSEHTGAGGGPIEQGPIKIVVEYARNSPVAAGATPGTAEGD